MKNISFLFLFVFLFGVSVTPAFAASSGARSAGTAVSDNSSGVGVWTGLSNVVSSNNLYTEAVATNLTEILKATNFGFAIPTTATINGIVVNFERLVPGSTTSATVRVVRIVKTGVVSGNNKAVSEWGNGEAQNDLISTYGSESDVWGLDISPSDINAADFGVALQLGNLCTSFCLGAGVKVDHIQITVYYTEAAAEASSGGGGTATWLIQLRQQNGLNAQGNPLSSSSSSSASSVSIEVPVETVTATDTTEGTASSASSSSSSVSAAQAVEWHWFSDTDQTPEPWVASFRLRVCDRIEGWFKTKPSSVLASVLPRLNDRLKSRWGFGCRASTSEGI